MMSPNERRLLVKKDKTISISKQCELLGISRSSVYYQPQTMSDLNLELMRIIDEHYLEHPYKGAPRMHVYLTKDLGYKVSRNRIERLYYKVMGLRAIFPGPHTSKRCKPHPVYPYLLRGLDINAPNQVWATDISYIPMRQGFLYLTAIIDLYSRFIVNWSISNTMSAGWCTDCFLEAIETHGKPEIMNTDQGSQYTSEEFSHAVLNQGVKLSMDGKGRATDNAFIECFWKTIKYEDIYIYCYSSALELYQGVKQYIHYYNIHRRHSSINNKRPFELYPNALIMKAS